MHPNCGVFTHMGGGTLVRRAAARGLHKSGQARLFRAPVPPPIVSRRDICFFVFGLAPAVDEQFFVDRKAVVREIAQLQPLSDG